MIYKYKAFKGSEKVKGKLEATSIKDAKEKTTANGRRMMSGKCPTCATKVNVFVSEKSKK